MLSAFTARPILELKQRDKSKIESILAYGDRLLVGLNTGSLRIYRVNEVPGDNADEVISKPSDKPASRPGSSSSAKPVELLRELEKFSTRSVEQLARIKEANILISLSNYYVSIHDLQSYTLQEQLMKTKNATTFAVTTDIFKDSATGIPEIISRLAVAVKRRLLLWSWHDSELSQETIEIALPESIRTLTWASATNIICGMNSGYVIVDVLSQSIDEVVASNTVGGASGAQGTRFGVGSTSMGYMGLGGFIPKPLATKLADGEMLLAKDINSLFITSDGKPVEKRQIPWQQAPDAIGYSYPYILALQPPSKGALEVRNPETLSLLQSISLPNASQLQFPPPGVSLAHAGKGFHVLSDRCIWRMGATDYDSQVDELVEKAKYDEAISLLNMLEDALLKNKEERLKEIKIQKAQTLFDQRKYRAAMDIFMAPDVQAPPERVIKLYPRSIAGDLSTLEETPKSEDPDTVDQHSHSNGDESATAETKKESLGSPRPAPLSKLLYTHQKANSDTSSVRSFMRLDGGEATENPSSAEKKANAPLEGKDFEDAAKELNQFLVQARNNMKQFLDAETGKMLPGKAAAQNGSSQATFEPLLLAPTSDAELDREKKLRETAKLIDTTLIRSYLLVAPSLARPFFRIPNFCDPEVVNERLLEMNRYNDLVDFFHGKKLHRQALQLLQKFGAADKPDENAPTLHGPQRIVGYLQNLPPEMIDLILEFAEWPLRVDPKLGMEIFVADSENAETLSRDKVADFLHNIDVGLEVQYLEHVINELNDLTPEFHNRLVQAYMDDLKKGQDNESDNWKDLMQRLISFLRSSTQYSLGKAFKNIPRDGQCRYLLKQQLILTHSIKILNFMKHKPSCLATWGTINRRLKYMFSNSRTLKKQKSKWDANGSMHLANELSYCNRVHVAQEPADPSPSPTRRPSATADPQDQAPSIYHTLLSLYLKPPPPHQPNWAPALDLLSKHGSRLPAASTLELIPKTLPVAELESYFRGRIRAANSAMNEARIEAHLRKSEIRSVQSTLLLGSEKPGDNGGRNRRVVVQEERVCGICHKRLGRSVVAVMPDNSVVHYACVGKVGAQKSDRLKGEGWGRR
ncbi:vacuolar morphogenesis protein-like protein AvaB [Bisporella sp. PMI_857]|nr:vacuolar morphogenesis protein-like protein AvaB [Bisporella sp. PMI_857]